MDDYESNCIVLRTILDSCLSNINKLKPLWHYGILLPEIEEDLKVILSLQSISFLGVIMVKEKFYLFAS